MQKPIIAIVGRPNVGKSTLFNRIIGKQIAIVEDIPGLTRDRLYGVANWSERAFIVVDTGGFQAVTETGMTRSREDIAGEVKKQTIAAINEADIVLMLMDSEQGLVSSDIELNNLLRKCSKKVFYAVNKIDGPKKEKAIFDFYSLGVDLSPVSALSGYGFEELMDSIVSAIPAVSDDDDPGHSRIAIVGRPNVGKSTLVNSLLGRSRMIVSPVPGTTRDAVDSVCSYYKKKYIIVDTAGIRKKGKMASTFERYSFMRTLKNIEDCDVALFLIDAVNGVVELDLKIAGLVYGAGKGSIIVLNKWDLLEKDSLSMKKVEDQLFQKLWFMRYAPVLTVSALSRQRITRIFPLVDEIISMSSKKIRTNELNNFLKQSLAIKQPPMYKGKKVKLSYISQVGIKPPRFVIFTNKKEGIKQAYIRFLEKKLRERFPLKGMPVRFYIKQKA